MTDQTTSETAPATPRARRAATSTRRPRPTTAPETRDHGRPPASTTTTRATTAATSPRRATSTASRTRATSPRTTSRSSWTSPTSTATWTWTSRATGPRSASSAATSSQLVGRNGEVLEALQELTRLAVYRETGERSRLMLDIGGFRADKRVPPGEGRRGGGGRGAAPPASARSLDPMSPFERKVVHDAVAAAGPGLGVRGRGAPAPRRGAPRVSLPVTDATDPLFHVKHPLRRRRRRGCSLLGCRWPSGTPPCWPTTGWCAG